VLHLFPAALPSHVFILTLRSTQILTLTVNVLLKQTLNWRASQLEIRMKFQVWWPPIWHQRSPNAPLTLNKPDAAGGFESGFREAALGAVGSGGQTREHAQLAKSLGVDQLAVVVSKLDTCGFSEDRFEEIRSARIAFICSAVLIIYRSISSIASWSSGHTACTAYADPSYANSVMVLRCIELCVACQRCSRAQLCGWG